MAEAMDVQFIAVVLGLILSILLLVYLLYLEIRARKRYKELKKVDRFIAETVKPEKIKYAEFLGIPAGSTGMSIYDVYAATDNHEVALAALKEKHNLILGGVDKPFEWLNYMSQKIISGDDTVSRVVNNIKGQLGEEEAIEFLNALPKLQESGITAELHENRSHPNTDIIFKDQNGDTVNPELGWFQNSEISVKTYSKDQVQSFIDKVKESDADHYLVNKELYFKLDETGKLQKLEESGVKVRNGGWSEEEYKKLGDDAFNDFGEAADVTSDIPVVAFLFMGYRTFGNTKKLYHGNITKEEFGTDFIVDGARATTAGIGGIAGGKAGMAAGTMIAPGIGTFIGGGIGVVAGAVGSSYMFKRFKDWFKYRKLKAQLLELADYYNATYYGDKDLSQKSFVIDQLGNNYFGIENTSIAIQDENRLMVDHSDEYDLYASEENYKQPTLMGALIEKHLSKLNAHYNAAKYSCEQVFTSLWRYCLNQRNQKMDKARLLITSILADFELTNHCPLPVFDDYKNELKKYPNNPYRVYGPNGVINGQSIVEYCLNENYQKYYSENKKKLVGKLFWAIGLSSIFIIFFVFVLIRMVI
ncbi:hypothetical protein [Rhodohalobacter barkolensis]|uniref:Uncharacterized protein n=1 Tax=Rhodohalobacter barkolensis TaxID=2053187 RepID=A0A2N0VHN7_9BACT|nr:hypothetical protein [Rhodohalobacter barkolensis]PKD43703.1 hypothetical protein CWD77_09080 [Rhodohalobacter barkolensis]